MRTFLHIRRQLLVWVLMVAVVFGSTLGAAAPGVVKAGAHPRLRASSHYGLDDARIRGSSFSARGYVEVEVYDSATGALLDSAEVRTTRNGNFAVAIDQPCYADVDIFAFDVSSGDYGYRELPAPGC